MPSKVLGDFSTGNVITFSGGQRVTILQQVGDKDGGDTYYSVEGGEDYYGTTDGGEGCMESETETDFLFEGFGEIVSVE